MINFLARIFIKEYQDYAKPEVRNSYGVLCGAVGIFLNIVLFASKFVAGTLARSVAMQTDAFNNLSDAASSIVTILGFKLAGKKPDHDHPFGHGRMEYVAGLIVSFLILMMGFELFKSSFAAIFAPAGAAPDRAWVSLAVMGFAVLVKLYMYLYNHKTAQKIDSPAMDATAKDSLSDVLCSAVVIASVLLSPVTTLPVDGIAGVIASIFILKTGIEAAMETISPLLGEPPEPEFVASVEKEVMSHEPICGIHDLIVHNYGPGRVMISLHAEVPGDRNIFDLHEAVDVAEVSVAQKFNCACTIHMDPINTEDKRLPVLKALAVRLAKEIDAGITVHDVRMVPGQGHTNLIFDAVRPHTCKLPHAELRDTLAARIHEAEPDVFCVITIDDPYV